MNSGLLEGRQTTHLMNLLVQVDVQCPYCGEEFAVTVDTSAGGYDTTEDCVVCCRPILFSFKCFPGEVAAVATEAG